MKGNKGGRGKRDKIARRKLDNAALFSTLSHDVWALIVGMLPYRAILELEKTSHFFATLFKRLNYFEEMLKLMFLDHLKNRLLQQSSKHVIKTIFKSQNKNFVCCYEHKKFTCLRVKERCVICRVNTCETRNKCCLSCQRFKPCSTCLAPVPQKGLRKHACRHCGEPTCKLCLYTCGNCDSLMCAKCTCKREAISDNGNRITHVFCVKCIDKVGQCESCQLFGASIQFCKLCNVGKCKRCYKQGCNNSESMTGGLRHDDMCSSCLAREWSAISSRFSQSPKTEADDASSDSSSSCGRSCSCDSSSE